MEDRSYRIEPGQLRLSPTDVSHYARLGQCERYLRLRLFERINGLDYLYRYDVQPQEIPPLLTLSGRRFERDVEAAIARRYPTVDCRGTGQSGSREPDNERLLESIRNLSPGAVCVLFQARIRVDVNGWTLTGDVDVLRLERMPEGTLRILVADIKSSTAPRVEHYLQVAFYHEMLTRLLAGAGIEGAVIEPAVLYRGPAGAGVAGTEEARGRARETLGVDALLEPIPDEDAYLQAVRDLVTGDDSVARRIAAAPFEELSYHLDWKCDGCLYNEFCMKWTAERRDLSLIPHLSAAEKSALRRHGIRTIDDLLALKRLSETGDGSPARLEPAPGQEERCRRLAVTWPVGPRLDELIYRATRCAGPPGQAAGPPPGRGHGSLPYSDERHNPNLVTLYLDAQHDYLHDRIYMLGTRVVARVGGQPARSENIVCLAEGPVDSDEKERELFARWIARTLDAVNRLAERDQEGRAPIHLVFYEPLEQQRLLEGLSRHLGGVLAAAPALYDFVTQIAAYDSPLISYLSTEIREQRYLPILCPSLYAVARYLGFDWNRPEPFAQLFRERIFDDRGQLEGADGSCRWYQRRARYSSAIPLEYACAAWGELPDPETTEDRFRGFRGCTQERLRAFQARRLEAMEHVASTFPGNPLTQKTPFRLDELARFSSRASSLAQALDEFVTIERHRSLGEWKAVRNAPPERRVLMGETLFARYFEEDQSPEAAGRNRENLRRWKLEQEYEAARREACPGEDRVQLTPEQRREVAQDDSGLQLRLRLVTDGLECTLEEALALCTLKEGDYVVVMPRWTVDTRKPPHERSPFTPTPKQMLYGPRARIQRFVFQRDEERRVTAAWVELEMQGRRVGEDPPGFVFASWPRPFEEGELYTLDPDPNDRLGLHCKNVAQGLQAVEAKDGVHRNALYERIARPPGPPVEWPPQAAEGQRRFLEGLDALARAGAFHTFEEAKRAYIGHYGDAGLLLVQGPPGTGKSYSTAFALLARLQGALAAGRNYRAVVCCKTHAATDVLLTAVRDARERLRALREQAPALFRPYFDERLLTVPLFRLAGREVPPEGIDALRDEPARRRIEGTPYCVVGATPAAIWRLLKKQERFRVHFIDALVLDEASQMNLPEAAMAAAALHPSGQIIVVGDHRQMPPIVRHDWDTERRRTFQEYRAYESLFLTLLPLNPPMVRFQESFRLHRRMADVLREEIYRQDGIDYFSRREELLPERALRDELAAAVLRADCPLVIVVHHEEASQTLNRFEEGLVTRILRPLADPNGFGLGPEEGVGVVVPHRAQRAALQLRIPELTKLHPETGAVVCTAVDTVERFQGGEREVILVSATESDREYLLLAGDFLLDPRRLTVALSRAKKKLVLVASRSVFELLDLDEETFRNAALWKRLLLRWCPERLWEGEIEGYRVEVRGAPG